MKEIIGLDLSISNTGYCKCNAESDTFEITDLGSIETKLREEHTKGGKKIVDKVYSLQERISIILNKLILKGIAQPDKIALAGLENYAFGAVGRSGTVLGELQGVMRYCLWANGVPKIVVAPQTLKAHAVGGSAGKGMVAMHARIKYEEAILHWGAELQNDDQADALVLCELTWLYYRWSKGLAIKEDLGTLNKKVIDRLQKIKDSAEE